MVKILEKQMSYNFKTLLLNCPEKGDAYTPGDRDRHAAVARSWVILLLDVLIKASCVIT